MSKKEKSKPKTTSSQDEREPSVEEPPLAYLGLAPGAGALLLRHAGGLDKVRTIRQGVPYDAIEDLSEKVNAPIKSFLEAFDLPQTTYNKKKREGETMSRRETEMLLYLNELIDYGLDVFNGEREKFLRWLRKPNLTLGGYTPESLFDSITGIREVRNCLGRIEYGTLA